jgi:hypothetical protein
MNEIRIEIAGMSIALLVDDPAASQRIREQYASFLAEGGVPELRIRVHVEEGDTFVPLDPGPWVIETVFENGRLDYASYLEKGFVDLLSGDGRLVLRPNASIENFLRVVYAWLCLGYQGLLLHASGVLREGKAFVFFGYSGSGKSTIAGLAAGHTVLSDDMVIIKKENGTYYAYGVPFRGAGQEAPRTNAKGELKGLFRLRKGPEHRVEPLRPATAISELLADLPFVVKPDGNIGAVMAIAQDVVRTLPVAELFFRRDTGFWSVIDDYC